MCRKYVLASEIVKIEARFNCRLSLDAVEIPRMYALASGDRGYVVTCQDPFLIQVFQFGMTPFYAESPMELITARAEGDKNPTDDPSFRGSRAIFMQPAFKKPIQSQRCIVIADAYYDWSADNKPYLIFLQNRERPFGMAGIYDQWKDPETGKFLESFAVITTTANPLLRSIGMKRMPVILSKSGERDWVKSSRHLSDVLTLLTPYREDRMNAYPVSEMIDRPYFNDHSLLNAVGEKLVMENNPLPVKVGGHKTFKEKPKSQVPWFNNNP